MSSRFSCRALLIGAAALTFTACSPGQTSGTKSPGPTPSPGRLFAVLEGDPQPSTIAIVGMDGIVRATADFPARRRPYIGNAAVPLQTPAQVVGSGVYYIDGYGTVRVLRSNAKPQVVASFPVQPVQFETWFAVSPDGSRVLAGIFQFPAIGPAPSPCDGLTCLPPLVGPAKFDLMSARSGSAPTVLQHFESSGLTPVGPGGLNPSFPVGWVADGAVVMLPISIGTQNVWYGGPLYVVDAGGQHTRQVGGPGCNSAGITSGQFIACVGEDPLNGVTVRDLYGNVLWTPRVDGFNALTLCISADGSGIANDRMVETRAGGLVSVSAAAFTFEGWLDNNTIVGRQFIGNTAERGDLSWISVSDPGVVHDLGIKGDFVGTLGS